MLSCYSIAKLGNGTTESNILATDKRKWFAFRSET